jgi:hypothetical protein
MIFGSHRTKGQLLVAETKCADEGEKILLVRLVSRLGQNDKRRVFFGNESHWA